MTIVSQNGLPEYSLGFEILPSFGESHWISGLGNRDLMSHVKQVPPMWGLIQKFQRLKPPPKKHLNGRTEAQPSGNLNFKLRRRSAERSRAIAEKEDGDVIGLIGPTSKGLYGLQNSFLQFFQRQIVLTGKNSLEARYSE